MGKFEMLCNLLPAEVHWGDPITPQMVEEIILAEREACAKACEEIGKDIVCPEECAEAIRMRSNVEVRGAEQASPAERPA